MKSDRQTVRLVTTYLEMREPSRLRRAGEGSRKGKFAIRELKERDWRFNREMYLRVGEEWKWIDKKPWTDEQWQIYARDPDLRTFGGYLGEELAGYYELHRDEGNAIEIAYFGLLRGFIGRGLGSALLTSAIDNAWNWAPKPSRVWVHTCNRDHPQALANYQARGLEIYKVEEEKMASP